jgi:outer membrane protein assembly factor BamB
LSEGNRTLFYSLIPQEEYTTSKQTIVYERKKEKRKMKVRSTLLISVMLSLTFLIFPFFSSYTLRMSACPALVKQEAALKIDPSTDWPMFLHDTRHTGYSTSTAPTMNGTLWVYAMGGRIDMASPIAADGFVYMHSYDTSKLYAINATNGELVWDFTIGNARRAPAVAHGVIYVGCGEPIGCKIYALNATTGASIWSYDTGEARIGTEISVADGMVFFGSFNWGRIFALNASTGSLIWKHSTSSSLVSSSPAVVDGVVYIGVYWENKVYAMNASTGEVIWQYETGSVVGPSPSVVEGIVYVGSHDQKIHAINATTGESIWTYTTGHWVRGSTAVAHGVVYVGSSDGMFYALNATTGVLKWVQTIGEASAPAVAGGKIYVGSSDCRIYCLNETTGAIIWTYTTGGWVSSPAIANGKVFVGSDDGKVYCFGSISLGAAVDIEPDALNLNSNGKWITCYIELLSGFNVRDIGISTILLNGTIEVDSEAPTQVGDYDCDGIADLMVKFDRAEAISYILANVNMTELIEKRSMTITLTITGNLNDGTPFRGSDTIKIIRTTPKYAKSVEVTPA